MKLIQDYSAPKYMHNLLCRCIIGFFCVGSALAAEPPNDNRSVVLFEDGFGQMPSGSLGDVVGAHAEYHYLRETGPKTVGPLPSSRLEF